MKTTIKNPVTPAKLVPKIKKSQDTNPDLKSGMAMKKSNVIKDLAYYQRRCELYSKQRDVFKRLYHKHLEELLKLQKAYDNMVSCFNSVKDLNIILLKEKLKKEDTPKRDGKVIQFHPRVKSTTNLITL